MNEDLKGFGGIATGLARSPLGIIALFIVLVYGLAALVLMVGRGIEPGASRPLIWFLVAFPVLVLGVFTFLVGWKQDKLIWPTDFKDERNYIDYTRALEAATSLGAASAKSAEGGSAPRIAPIVAAVQSATASRAGETRARPGKRPRLLWVDDRPSNNSYERRAFEAVGIEITLATSTDEAMDALDREDFDIIVSDMGRPEGTEAGLDLLARIRGRQDRTPFFIYAGSRAVAMRSRVLQQGGDGCTNDPQELFELVTTAALKVV